jgi:hypothetical protein
MIMADTEMSGPFGNPDGARADLDDLLRRFVDFDGDAHYGDLATRANDATVRVVVGKLGAGKTVYMRRLRDFQRRQESVYADLPQQSLAATDEVVKVCQWYRADLLEQKWKLLWNRAVLRALASHLLCRPELSQHITTSFVGEIESTYSPLIGGPRRAHSVYAELRQIINTANTAHQLDRFLTASLWDDLEAVLAEAIHACPPVFFYLDGVDEEFSSAPAYWLHCQKGLFYEVMTLLRDARFGGKLHVVVTIRDLVFSSVLRSEHAPRYIGEPHIRLLSWTRESLGYFLDRKLEALEDEYFAGRIGERRSCEAWLGHTSITGRLGSGSENVVDYLLRHTRLIPRDVVSLGNALCAETRAAKRRGDQRISNERLSGVVSAAARRFGDSQVAQCSNQVASDMMPDGAGLYELSDIYTAGNYVRKIDTDLRGIVQAVGAAQFGLAELSGLRQIANSVWGASTDLPSVLWQNGLLGYVSRTGEATFYSLGHADEFHLPDGVSTYAFHPCLVAAVSR